MKLSSKFFILSSFLVLALSTSFTARAVDYDNNRSRDPQAGNSQRQVRFGSGYKGDYVIKQDDANGRYQGLDGTGAKGRDQEYGRVNLEAPRFSMANRIDGESTPLPGGFQVIVDINQNKDALAALNYAKSNLAVLSSAPLLKASFQVVNGFIYNFIFEVGFFTGSKLRYSVQIYRSTAGKFQIQKSDYSGVSKNRPRAQDFQHFQAADAKDIKIIDEINNQVVYQLKDLMTADAQFLDFDMNPPYFLMNYQVSKGGVVAVDLTYDIVTNVANILSAVKKTKSTVPIVAPAPPSSSERVIEKRGPILSSIPLINSVPVISQNRPAPSSGLVFSELVSFSDQICSQYQKIDKSEPEIKEVIKNYMDTILRQISTLSTANQQLKIGYQLVGLRYRLMGSTLKILIILEADMGGKFVMIGTTEINGAYVKNKIQSEIQGQSISVDVNRPDIRTIEKPMPTSVLIPAPNPVPITAIKPIQQITTPEPKPTPIPIPTPTVIVKPQPKPEQRQEPIPIPAPIQIPVQTVIKPEPKQQNLPATPPLIIHNKPTTTPSFSVTQNSDQLLDKINGISDPALIPFLTSSDPANTKQLDQLAKFLIDKVKITSDFSIVLINQIKYGIRFVIQMKQDHKLFEAVITSDNQEPQLLIWRRISAIGDADPDIFAQYFRINPDQDLTNLIRDVFKSEQMIHKFKEIVSAEKKITYDGIYYRFIVESTSGNRFLIVFYYIPDRKYNEIIRYELLNNPFNTNLQIRLESVPETDLTFNAAREYLFRNYAGVLKDTAISFVSRYQANGRVFLRLVFVGLGGKYETILMVGAEGQGVTVCKWQKMEDGYIPVDVSKLNSNEQYRSIRSSVREYIQNKFNFQADPSYLQLKNIPNSNTFFKFLFTRPFPFILFLEERNSDHSLYIRGLQRIQIAPSNEYYNDRIFAGFVSVGPSQLKYDQVYEVFFSLLQKETQVTERNSQIVAAFRMKTPEGLYYKIVYRVNGVDFLASFSYIFVKAEYKLLSFDTYQRVIEEGDYRWKCSSIDTKAKQCSECVENTLLAAGRCYKKIEGCTLQVASSCHTCQPGFIRTNQLCEKSPQKAVPKAAPLETIQKIIPTASGPKTITYQNGNDQNCLVYKSSGCSLCANRFFIQNGICKKVQDQCQQYQETGTCTKCYSGYYLNNNACIPMDPLCAQANPDGSCSKCYKNYLNLDGKCYIQSNIALKTVSEAPRDQLCLEWNGSACLRCEFGCFLSKKNGLCTIKDAYCQEFEEGKEECVVCQRGYKKNGGSGKCQRSF